MKILIAEDDAVSRCLLETTLKLWGYDVTAAPDGSRAWEALQTEAAPQLVILDWMMPGLDGPEICRRVREAPQTRATYAILLTARDSREDLIRGLQSGADDYLSKPFDRRELRVRVEVGVRILQLQEALAARVRELEDAMARVKLLQGLLPICCYCKKIRNDRNYWQQVEHYITEHSGAQFSHGICPECYEKFVQPELAKLPCEEEEC